MKSRPPFAAVSSRQKSAVTNGNRLFVRGSQQSPWARRFKDILTLHLEDMGGADSLTEAQISIARRCTTLEIELEVMEADLANGKEVDLDLYQRASNTLGRLLDRIGIKVTKKRTSNPLADYFSRPAPKPE